MKKIILIFSLLTFVVCPVSASELTGQISTNPSELPEPGEDPVLPSDDPIPPPNDSGGNGGSSSRGASLIIDKRHKQDDPYQEEIKVLGISREIYPDGTLFRGRDKKIYIIEGQVKKHIASLAELKKYAGQIIYKITDAELAAYQKRKHLNNDLIREQGREEVYIIKNNKRRHILSLEELRTHYFGQEIFNVSSMEMKLYS